MRYYIVETQETTSGDINFVTKEQYSFGNALNYYHTRLANISVVTEGYSAFHISLLDANMEIVQQGSHELHEDITIPVQ